MNSVVRLSEINQSKQFEFNLILSNKRISDLVKRLDVLKIKKLSFLGTLSSISLNEWKLKAELRATVKQRCVVSSEPVQTTIHEKISRTFSPLASQNSSEPDDDGISPVIFDDTLQELNDHIDLAEIIFEELTLILPNYPKIEGAELGYYSVTEPGAKPLTEENIKPFAQLSKLKDKLSNKK